MKNTIALLPLAAVIGGLIGAWGPSEELRAYKERPGSAKTEERSAKRTGFDPIAQFINVPEAAKRPRREKPRADESGQSAAEALPAGTNEVAEANVEVAVDVQPPKPRKMLPPEDLQARIDEASELWRTRIQLARAGALEKLGIPENGADSFDTALADMNDKLRESMQAIADALANEEAMTPELGIRLMGDISTTLAETYDQLGTCVDPSKRGDVAEMQLVEFIDPSVAEPLIAVKDKIDGRAFSGRRNDR